MPKTSQAQASYDEYASLSEGKYFEAISWHTNVRDPSDISVSGMWKLNQMGIFSPLAVEADLICCYFQGVTVFPVLNMRPELLLAYMAVCL